MKYLITLLFFSLFVLQGKLIQKNNIMQILFYKAYYYLLCNYVLKTSAL